MAGWKDLLSSNISLFKKSAFSSKGGSVLGIDIGSSSIKVVQLVRKSGAAVLETYGEIALGPYAGSEVGRATNLPPEKIAEALSDVIREANVTTKNAGVSIPFGASLITMMELPAIPEKQLATAIPIEARKYIPVPISEVTLDWFIVPAGERKFISKEDTVVPGVQNTTSRGKTNVLLVAIHNEVLTKYGQILSGAQLDTSFSEIEIFSTARSTLEQGIAPVGVLDIGAGTSKLYVVEYGLVRSSHNIQRGSQDATLTISSSLGISVAKAEELKRMYGLLGSPSQNGEAEQVKKIATSTFEHIFLEANRALVSYERQSSKSVSKIILTGGGAVTKGLLPFASSKLETEVLLADPFAKTQTPAFLERILKEVGPEFSVAVGVALRKLAETE